MARKCVKKSKGKKGVSAIIATVLLVLITIVAIGIIWGVLLPFIQKSLASARACGPQIQLKIVTEQGYTCYNANENITYVQIERDFTEEMPKMVIKVSGEGKTVPVKVPNDYPAKVNRQELPPAGGGFTYAINLTAIGISTPAYVEVYPVIRVGADEIECTKNVYRQTLSPCSV